MLNLQKGRYIARIATSDEDVRRAQHLRFLCFVNSRDTDDATGAVEADDLDPQCLHVLIEDMAGGALLGCFRMLPMRGSEIDRSYSARYYGLEGLRGFSGRLLEMGRFCIHPAAHTPDVLRIAWGALTRYVEEEQISLLFGCASFSGTEPARYLDAFALLNDRYLARREWLPKIKATEVHAFAHLLAGYRADLQRGRNTLPALLRSYVEMGGRVSDHTVVDRQLNTLHVFTMLEIGKIPVSRRRLLHAVSE